MLSYLRQAQGEGAIALISGQNVYKFEATITQRKWPLRAHQMDCFSPPPPLQWVDEG